ncbi:matrixin family metalloprotease [Candidatus Micrarchaeota archaeon]|nr:matrixin family metalloprotease [Candidatus Micrarchaeota archaeon]
MVLVLGVFAAALFLSGISHAETTWSRSGCDITITIKMAFAGANASFAAAAENETEGFWNGPRGFRTTGECKCTVEVKLETTLVADCKNNAPAGYHCITVTKFFKPDGTYDDPPRNQTNITGAEIYVAYVNGVARGNGSNSQGGWFSDLTSRPVNSANPAGPHYMDFAHEAGHLMGLGHNNNTSSIMNNTLVTEPSQDDIDGIVENICGKGACPDSCCCGNGIVEKNKSENCDPRAAPNGCAQGASCCPVCCNCYKPLCVPSQGEFPDSASCQSACGPGFGCYMNYKTGCWNCVKQEAVVTGSCLDGTKIRGNLACDHLGDELAEDDLKAYYESLSSIPVLGGLFATERINIATKEGDAGHIITKDGQIVGYGMSLLDDPSVKVSTDRETIGLLEKGEISIQQAISAGRIAIDGGDFFSGMRLGLYHLMFDVYNLLSPEEAYAPLEAPAGPACGADYTGRMEEIFADGGAPSEPAGYGPVPDAPIQEPLSSYQSGNW